MAFGRADADDFLNELPADQFDKWKVYAALEPFGARADDERNGLAIAVFANANRDKEKKREPFTAADFMTCKSLKTAKKKSLPLRVQRERMEAYLGKPNG